MEYQSARLYYAGHMAEPLVSGIGAKILASLASDSIKLAMRSIWRHFSENDELVVPLRAQLSELIQFVESQIDSSIPSDQVPSTVHNYLRSAECITAMEHIFAFRMTGRAIRADGPIDHEVRLGSESYGLRNVEDQETLFRVLLATADMVLRQAGVTPEDSPGSSLSEKATASAIEAYLRSIDSQLSLMARDKLVLGAELQARLDKYSVALSKDVGFIQPPNLEGAQPVPIDDIYVLPSLTSIGIAGRPTKQVELDDLAQLPRAVVLGDPGGGKTTLTRKLAYDLLGGQLSTAGRDCNLLTYPIVVVLREFGKFLERTPGSLVDYMTEALRSDHQISLNTATLEWLLGTSRVYVIFDGLDELLDLSSRQKVARAITSFAAVYPNVNILVTSRRVGYMQAPLGDVFKTVSLGDFGANEVEEYVHKWFAIATRAESDAQQVVESKFMEESATVPDLRRNPLMLALICSIYRTESYIPRNRPDVYEKCSKMLFDRWDRHRGLLRPFEFEAHIEPALMHVAYMIYTGTNSASGVKEAELVDHTAAYLHSWQYEDEAKARHAAAEFIVFCRGRAWVFTDVGLTPDNESLYNFTHRTFLEYFTAAYLCRVHADLESLLHVLVPHISVGEWDVVAQLAIQIKSKGLQGGSDFVATELISHANADKTLSITQNVLSFIRRCMTFLTTSPSITRKVGNALVDGSVRMVEKGGKREAQGGKDIVEEILGDLHLSAREVRNLLCLAVVERIEILLSPEAEQLSESVAATGWLLLEFRASLPVEFDARLRQFMLSVLAQHHEKWPWATAGLIFSGSMTPSEVLQTLGLDRLVRFAKLPGTSTSYVPVVAFILRQALANDTSSRRNGLTCEAAMDACTDIAEHVRIGRPIDLTAELPGVDERALSPSYFAINRRDRIPEMAEKWADILVCAALLFEVEMKISKSPSASWSSENYDAPIKDFFSRRIESTLNRQEPFSGSHGTESGKVDLPDELLRLWAMGQVSLVRDAN